MNTRIILLAFSLLFSLPAAEAGQEWKTDKSDSIELACSERTISKISRSQSSFTYFCFPRVVALANTPGLAAHSTIGFPVDRTIAFRRLLI